MCGPTPDRPRLPRQRRRPNIRLVHRRQPYHRCLSSYRSCCYSSHHTHCEMIQSHLSPAVINHRSLPAPPARPSAHAVSPPGRALLRPQATTTTIYSNKSTVSSTLLYGAWAGRLARSSLFTTVDPTSRTLLANPSCARFASQEARSTTAPFSFTSVFTSGFSPYEGHCA